MPRWTAVRPSMVRAMEEGCRPTAEHIAVGGVATLKNPTRAYPRAELSYQTRSVFTLAIKLRCKLACAFSLRKTAGSFLAECRPSVSITGSWCVARCQCPVQLDGGCVVAAA